MLYSFNAEQCQKYKNKGPAHPHRFILHWQNLNVTNVEHN